MNLTDPCRSVPCQYQGIGMHARLAGWVTYQYCSICASTMPTAQNRAAEGSIILWRRNAWPIWVKFNYALCPPFAVVDWWFFPILYIYSSHRRVWWMWVRIPTVAGVKKTDDTVNSSHRVKRHSHETVPTGKRDTLTRLLQGHSFCWCHSAHQPLVYLTKKPEFAIQNSGSQLCIIYVVQM